MKTNHKASCKLNRLTLHTDRTNIVTLETAEFGLITKGRLEIHNRYGSLVINSNECYILPDGYHQFTYSCNEEGCFESVNFHSHDSLSTEICRLINHQFFRPTSQITTSQPNTYGESTHQQHSSYAVVNRDLSHNHANEDCIKLALRLSLFALLSVNEVETHRLISPYYTEEFMEFDRIVRSNLLKRVTIGEIAEQSCRSYSDFKRTFIRIFGDTPHRWFMTKRLALAGLMLLNTTFTVKEIANYCCFSSSSHFIRIFSREYGLSPTNYREKYGQREYESDNGLTKCRHCKLNNFNNERGFSKNI